MIRVNDDRVLKLPYRGAPQTVGVIRRAAIESQNHIAVRELCEIVSRDLASKDAVSEILAWHYFLIANTRYMRDPRTVELVKAPHLICQEIMWGGRPSIDCDDYSGVECAGGLAMGGSARLVTVAFRDMFHEGRRQFSHVFGEVQTPNGVWVALDPVAAEETPRMLRRVVAAKTWPVA